MFLLPIEEDNPTRNSAYAVWALIGLNVAAFLGMVVHASRNFPKRSVIGDRSGFPITEAFLSQMNRYWFQRWA